MPTTDDGDCIMLSPRKTPLNHCVRDRDPRILLYGVWLPW